MHNYSVQLCPSNRQSRYLCTYQRPSVDPGKPMIRHFENRRGEALGTRLCASVRIFQFQDTDDGVFPRASCLGSAKAVQCPCPGPNIGDTSQFITSYSPICPRGQPPRMAADKCIPFYCGRDEGSPLVKIRFRLIYAGIFH